MKSAILVLLVSFGLSSCFQDKDSESNDTGRSSSKEKAEPSAKSEYRRIRDEVAGLKKVKRELEGKIDDFEDSQQESSTLVQKEIEVAGELEEIRKYRDALNSHEEALDQSLAQWRTATRGSFKGVKLPGIETVKGEQYSDVTISNIDDESITFEHSGGVATILVIELPLSLRKNVIHEATVLADKAMN